MREIPPHFSSPTHFSRARIASPLSRAVHRPGNQTLTRARLFHSQILRRNQKIAEDLSLSSNTLPSETDIESPQNSMDITGQEGASGSGQGETGGHGGMGGQDGQADLSVQTNQRLNNLDSRMDRVTTSLELLISIMKNTEPKPPPQPQLHFEPVSTAPSANRPHQDQFAFVSPQQPQNPNPVTQSQTSGQPTQGAVPLPIPFPTDQTAGQQQPVYGGTDGNNPVYLEPQKLPEIWFSGDTKQLAQFLRVIRDFLYPRQAFFTSQSRMIVWISRHFGFGYRPTESKRDPSPAENWYNSLITSNARAQGVEDPYADLDRIPFLHPMLLTVTAFEKGLIDTFGDKFQLDTAKKALAACKQGKQSVEEYNAQYSTLCYQVVNSEDARIDSFVFKPKIVQIQSGT
ncbi:hypothetical protein PGT21_010628 [Puccinia graminis f. sp. tritici]|uniref:Uncharacterized protein n=1 Tax=Puccinia graminis f. sp. tritici TaxID=56615 RepID=A0A5B0LT09_PUCGR|nr:hypothetical protein PGT21_010628 [Puccinia graminis f. sp. tritici]KAA1092166.1 hypothetical protein PGTUg99_012204 [Puccinia graminis f. sp. tritici]